MEKLGKIKLELVLPAIYLDKLEELLNENGITGFTEINIVGGQGPMNGNTHYSGVLPTAEQTLVLSIIDEAVFENFRDSLSSFLIMYGGIYWTTAVLDCLILQSE